MSAEGFRFAEATGRAVIMHEAATDEARMIALEDALYQVALQGGAEVNGFSAVTTDTTLSDHFVVRPSSRILDYTITNEIVDDDHYMVTVRAAVGALPKAECATPRHNNVTVFAPSIYVGPTVPAWYGFCPIHLCWANSTSMVGTDCQIQPYRNAHADGTAPQSYDASGDHNQT